MQVVQVAYSLNTLASCASHTFPETQENSASLFPHETRNVIASRMKHEYPRLWNESNETWIPNAYNTSQLCFEIRV
jgi:hypothetical protein